MRGEGKRVRSNMCWTLATEWKEAPATRKEYLGKVGTLSGAVRGEGRDILPLFPYFPPQHTPRHPFHKYLPLNMRFQEDKYLLCVSLYGREIARTISLLRGHEPHNYNPIKAVPRESSPSSLPCVAVKHSLPGGVRALLCLFALGKWATQLSK